MVNSLSICITVKNRSIACADSQPLILLPRTLEAVRKVFDTKQAYAEVVISDWESADLPLAQWVPGVFTNLRVNLVTVHENRFSRGRGRNIAAANAQYDNFLFLDAETLVSGEVEQHLWEALERGDIFFPVCWSETRPDGSCGRWREKGKGVTAMTRSQFDTLGGWDELYTWGGEDVSLYNRAEKHFNIHRPKIKSLVHIWHPTDIRWLNNGAAK